MKFLIYIFVLATCLLASKVQPLKSFRGHKVVTFRIENEEQLQEIQKLEKESGFVFIDPPVQVNMKIELVMHPDLLEMFTEIAADTKIDFEIKTDDLQSWIDKEKPLKSQKAGFSLNQYNLLEDIYEFVDNIQAEHSDRATVINIGESYEGRPLKVIKISTNENNPVIFIEANIHAREWISSATAVWLINELLTTTDASVKAITDSVTWYILPVTNPDGYKFTHEENRLWRKTRSVHNIFCRGVDPNRNFAYNWRMGGSSRLACTDTYMGPTAFSEKETKAVMDFYATIANKSDAYISFHSAAEMLLYPMGHTSATDLVPNVADLITVGEAAVKAIEDKYGVVYRFGNIVTTLYVASGSSVDHAYGTFKTPIVYTYEFRVGRGTGSSFILPPEEIVPNSEEIFDSLLAIINTGRELGYFNMKG